MIFVDTSFWFALRRRRDRRHAPAVELFKCFDGEPLVTTSLVCGELWTLVRRGADHRSALEALDAIGASPRVEVLHVDGDLEDVAWAWLRLHDERPYSFVDATSFALMRRLRIADALAFDGDFAAAGFKELRPEA